ncbi:MAG: hypothetical protein PVH37_06000 [Desulfobacterales bacterium]|jgi:hypothetical protein
MNDDWMQAERRQHQRYRVQKNALALLRNKSIYPGYITEISMGGMAFQYHSNNGKTPEASELDIISANYTEVILIRHIGIKTVSDLAVSKKHVEGSTYFRKHVVRFETLSRGQTSKLKHFIQAYSSGRLS